MSSSTPPQKKHLSAKPTRNIFDAWNTSSSGHQRAENRLSGSTSWRQSRTLKLASQFSSGAGGGKRVADTVGAGSEDFGKDGRLENGGWERGAKGLRKDGQKSVLESFGVTKQVCREKEEAERRKKAGEIEAKERAVTLANCGWEERLDERDLVLAEAAEETMQEQEQEMQLLADRSKVKGQQQHQVFKGLTVYINGSTAPLISDHKLKRLLVEHGANLSIALGRRTVTHVILGRPNGNTAAAAASSAVPNSGGGGGGSAGGQGPGSGGGLAATKSQKEIKSKVGNGVKFVTVEWVMESVKLGKRAPEAKFAALRLAPNKTGDLADMFAKRAQG